MYKYGILLSAELVSQALPTEARVSVIMGSQSDWSTVQPCCDLLEHFAVHFEYGVVSAHRTPKRLATYVPELQYRGVQVLIACAGGSAHLPGMSAAETFIPVLGFGPTSSKFGAMDVLGSNVRMPAGVPLAFMGFDDAGAKNAALEAVRILALQDQELRKRLIKYVKLQTETVPYAAHNEEN